MTNIAGEYDDQVIRVCKGDLEAYGEIVSGCQPSIRAWVVSRCPPGGDADDVTQKTFVAAFRRIGEYQTGTNFIAWLFTIARYQLMAECSRLKRLADYHSRYVPHALSEELERRIEDRGAESTRLVHLRECIDAVGADARNLLDWRYSQEVSLAEIAQRSQRSVAAVKKRLFVLRRKLHECIEQKNAMESV